MNAIFKGVVCLLVAVVIGMIATTEAQAQYSQSVFDLKKISELYDERGFEQGKAITVDGKLMVSNANGNVSYSYPISKTTVSGYPLTVELNYCGSVAFTSFRKYVDGFFLDPYVHWEKFHQNRPAWILGINGFAVQILGSTGSFHSDSAFARDHGNRFNDSSLVWAADGYDFCNRMAPIWADGATDKYVDVIRLLRADGSLLELVNAQGPRNQTPSLRPELFSGHYFVNGGNEKGYGVVEFDSTYWPHYIKRYVDSLVGNSGTYPFIPRKLKYYPGDGTELVFREWVIPYGLNTYLGRGNPVPNRWGGMTNGPTIFYLEEINSNAGPITTITRSRHLYPATDVNGNTVLDSTVGRALTTGLLGHTFEYSGHWMTIQAFGRTTQVQFMERSASGLGDGRTGATLPMTTRGYLTPEALAHANDLDFTAGDRDGPYASYVSYVGLIRDPEGRQTTFDYEQYGRHYVNFGFPYANSLDSIILTLKNLRLTKVDEPTASYHISYWSGNDIHGTGVPEDVLLDANLYPNLGYAEDHPFQLNNVASYVRKYDRQGTLLTTQYGHYNYDLVNQRFTDGYQRMTDNITGFSRSVTTSYDSYRLDDYFRWLPTPRYTVLKSTVEEGGGVTTNSSTSYPVPGQRANLFLPIAQTVSVNGVMKSRRTFSYMLDTLRHYGGNGDVTNKFGWEVTGRVQTTLHPATQATLLRDTTILTYLPALDTTLTAIDTVLLLDQMMAKYATLKSAGQISASWENAMYDPRVYTVQINNGPVRRTLPPVYGLLKELWSSDAVTGQYLGGMRKEYIIPANPQSFNDLAFRGLLRADSVIGEDRSRTILSGMYEYRRGWGRMLLAARRNANGGATALDYSYGSGASGRIAYDNNVVHDTTLPDATYFSTSFEQPARQMQLVRRVDLAAPTGIVTDTLARITELGHYGQIRSTVDPNGYLGAAQHDRDGRLKRAWLPLDFPRREAADTATYVGSEPLGLYGQTRYDAVFDTLHCRESGDTNTLGHGTATSSTLAGLTASHPITAAPKCPCGIGPLRSKRDDEPQILAEPCASTKIYPASEYNVGIINYGIDANSPLLVLSPITSAKLRLYPTAISSGCVTLQVKVPQFSFSNSYTFNCSTIPLNGSPVDTTLMLEVDLSSIAAGLATLRAGDKLTVELHVTTPNGSISFVDGSNGEDTRPTLVLGGTFHKISDGADYTLAYDHNDTTLSNRVTAKVDDINHTANRYDLNALRGATVRWTEWKNEFGADYRLDRTRMTIGDPAFPVRVDTTSYGYNGLGTRTWVRDAEGDNVENLFDTVGRPIARINADGTRAEIEYMIGTPSSLGVGSQEFYGFCTKTALIDEMGRRVLRYTDAYDRLRREVVDSGAPPAHLNLITTYDYDVQGRLTRVENPAHQVMTYTYDLFGRVKTKTLPDAGTISYAYDDAGNVRFTQNQEQQAKNLLAFTEYDDLNRPTLIGEAVINRGNASPFCEDSLTWGASAVPDLPGNRLTDQYDPNKLHTIRFPSILTANLTLDEFPGGAVPTFHVLGPIRTDTLSNCVLSPSILLGETSAPPTPLIEHPVKNYFACTGTANDGDFEDMKLHGDFARIGISYDRMPTLGRSVWGMMAPKAIWDVLAPTGQVRNQNGREAAVAYRDRGSEPFHYTVMSYDQRGRVEAILRSNENLGFDAVYYTYNSMNLVTSVTTADPLRSHTTWYGYDHNGRVDSVWTLLGPIGSGLVPPANIAARNMRGMRYPTPLQRPQGGDIAYTYTKNNQIETMWYPPINVYVDYHYNHRKALESSHASQINWSGTNPYTPLFYEKLEFDSSGLILKQNYSHGLGGSKNQTYLYDNANRLTTWTQNNDQDTTSYTYDDVGNRKQKRESWDNANPETFAVAGMNQLSIRSRHNVQVGDTAHLYEYDRNGNMKSHKLQLDSSKGAWTGFPVRQRGIGIRYREDDRYSFRGLHTRLWREDSLANVQDWRYRYSASGEREQKRLIYTSQPDAAMPYPWVYYLLGGNNQQLAVYHGQQTIGTICGDTGRRVYMYPTEYLTYGAGGISAITTLPNGTKQYKLVDHLGSTRSVVTAGGGADYDYEPFGGLLNAGGASGPRKGFIDRETDRESGYGNFGVRQNEVGRGGFTSTDPLAEQYRSWSSYHYAANNPLLWSDGSGLGYDFTGVVIHDSGAAVQAILIKDLEEKTGLSLYLDDQNHLQYKVENGQPVVKAGSGSEVARQLLIESIDNPQMLPVNLGYSLKNGSQIYEGSMYLDGDQINGFIQGASPGLNPTTMGWAITFLHESVHTTLASSGGLPDASGFGKIGGVEGNVINVIRAQLGKGYGQRSSYEGLIGDDGAAYIPFNSLALQQMQQKPPVLPPAGLYIKMNK